MTDRVPFDLLAQSGVMPIVTTEEVRHAVPVARALVAGGVSVAEFTLRTDAGLEAIAQVRREVPELCIGVGTVLTPQQVDASFNAGAEFAVTPGLNARVVERAQFRQLPIAPGVATPTDVEAAMELGLRTLKLFPASVVGGVSLLKALSGPYRDVSFVATGGVTTENLNDYLALPNVIGCGGSWLTPKSLLSDENYVEIERRAAEAMALCRGEKK